MTSLSIDRLTETVHRALKLLNSLALAKPQFIICKLTEMPSPCLVATNLPVA